jgi:hypothetical protein
LALRPARFFVSSRSICSLANRAKGAVVLPAMDLPTMTESNPGEDSGSASVVRSDAVGPLVDHLN